MPWEDIRAAKAEHEAELFRRANVVGVAVGRKVVAGRETDETCIVVYVDRKVAREELGRRDIVPPTVDGVPTDVVETGRFTALPLLETLAISRTRRMRPAPGGVSIAHERVTAGTLGVLARTPDGGGVILSNNHVLANSNEAAIGDRILQPGPADGGRRTDAIGVLGGFVPIRFAERDVGPFARLLERGLAPLLRKAGLGLKRLPSGQSNVMDAAFAVPDDPDDVAPDVLEIGRVRGTAAAGIGTAVRKSGRTTGLTRGRVTGLDAVVEVDYGGKTAVFREQLVSDALSRGGDSGSLVVDDANRGVGLLFAGGLTTTLMNPIEAVLAALGVAL